MLTNMRMLTLRGFRSETIGIASRAEDEQSDVVDALLILSGVEES